MADPGVSGQNFLSLLFGGPTGQGGLGAVPREMGRQRAQQADLTLALQKMLQGQEQFDASLAQQDRVAAAADSDRDASRRLSQARHLEDIRSNKAGEKIATAEQRSKNTYRLALAEARRASAGTKGALSEASMSAIAKEYEGLLSDHKTAVENFKNLKLLIPDFEGTEPDPVMSREAFFKQRVEDIGSIASLMRGGGGQGAGGVDVSNVGDDELGALFNDFVGGQ